MISTALPFETLLSHGNANPNPNPLFSLYGEITPWENNLECFFNSSQKYDESKLNSSDYNADLVLDSDISNQKSVETNVSGYLVGSNIGLKSQNESLPCFHQPNLSHYQISFDLGSNHCPNQQSPCSNKNSNDDQDQSNQNSPASTPSSGGSDDPNQNQNTSPCPDYPVQGATTMDERKRKRMISNRESARRSRMRKQRHVENLRNDVNGLKIQTREKSNQLRVMTHQINLVRRENDRLKAESITLQRKLMQLTQIWQLQQLQRQCSYHHPHPPPPPPPPASSCTPMQIII